jgi:hypothetical protein
MKVTSLDGPEESHSYKHSNMAVVCSERPEQSRSCKQLPDSNSPEEFCSYK